MDLNDLHPPDDYSHRFFIWHEWIQVILSPRIPCLEFANDPYTNQANGPLNNDNVFEYFTTSMFYDKQSNNQVLRMQTAHRDAGVFLNEAEELKSVQIILPLPLMLTCQ